jgi:hypothetical protein
VIQFLFLSGGTLAWNDVYTPTANDKCVTLLLYCHCYYNAILVRENLSPLQGGLSTRNLLIGPTTPQHADPLPKPVLCASRVATSEAESYVYLVHRPAVHTFVLDFVYCHEFRCDERRLH